MVAHIAHKRHWEVLQRVGTKGVWGSYPTTREAPAQCEVRHRGGRPPAGPRVAGRA